MQVERKAEWDNLEAVLTEPKLMVVTDASIEGYEHLEFPRDRVVEFALGWGHLVVATATQVCSPTPPLLLLLLLLLLLSIQDATATCSILPFLLLAPL